MDLSLAFCIYINMNVAVLHYDPLLKKGDISLLYLQAEFFGIVADSVLILFISFVNRSFGEAFEEHYESSIHRVPFVVNLCGARRRYGRMDGLHRHPPSRSRRTKR